MVIRLGVRRFSCRNPACPRVTFAEQVNGLTGRYLRRSLPLLGLLGQVGLALAARGPAGRHAGRRDWSPRCPKPGIGAAPQILGVYDFALRRGHVYGTVRVDIATGNTPRPPSNGGSAVRRRPGQELLPVRRRLLRRPGRSFVIIYATNGERRGTAPYVRHATSPPGCRRTARTCAC